MESVILNSTDFKILKYQPKQNDVDYCKCMYAFSQNREDRIMTSFQNKNESEQFKKMENSDSDTDEENCISKEFTVHRCKINSAKTQANIKGTNDTFSFKLHETILFRKKSNEIKYVDNDKNGVKKSKNVTEDQINRPDWWKRKMSFKQRSKHTSHRKPTKLNVISLSIICMILCAMKVKTIQCADAVSLKVTTSPIVFGQTLDLQCNISNSGKNCDIRLRTWYSSNGNVVLCQNGNCRNQTKYSERKNADCSYSLQIADLSIDDIDTYYTCSYGVIELKKGLMKKDFNFIKLPKKTNTSITIEKSSKILNISVQIEDVFPKPICHVKLKKRNLTGVVNISSNQDKMYFNYQTKILYNITTDDCGSDITVLCLIGKLNVTDSKQKLNICAKHNSFNSISDSNMIVASVPFVVIVLSILGMMSKGVVAI